MFNFHKSKIAIFLCSSALITGCSSINYQQIDPVKKAITVKLVSIFNNTDGSTRKDSSFVATRFDYDPVRVKIFDDFFAENQEILQQKNLADFNDALAEWDKFDSSIDSNAGSKSQSYNISTGINPNIARQIVRRAHQLRRDGKEVNGLTISQAEFQANTREVDYITYGPFRLSDDENAKADFQRGRIDDLLVNYDDVNRYLEEDNKAAERANLIKQRSHKLLSRDMNTIFQSVPDQPGLEVANNNLADEYYALLNQESPCRLNDEISSNGLSCRELTDTLSKLDDSLVDSAAGSYLETFPILNDLSTNWKSDSVELTYSEDSERYVSNINIAEGEKVSTRELEFSFVVVPVNRPWFNSAIMSKLAAKKKEFEDTNQQYYISGLVMVCLNNAKVCSRITDTNINLEQVYGYLIQPITPVADKL